MKDRKINPPEIDEEKINMEKMELLYIIRNAVLLAKKSSIAAFPYNLPIQSISVDNDHNSGEMVIQTTSGNEYTIRMKDIAHNTEGLCEECGSPMKTAMVDGIGHNLDEQEICSNNKCKSHRS